MLKKWSIFRITREMCSQFAQFESNEVDLYLINQTIRLTL